MFSNTNYNILTALFPGIGTVWSTIFSFKGDQRYFEIEIISETKVCSNSLLEQRMLISIY